MLASIKTKIYISISTLLVLTGFISTASWNIYADLIAPIHSPKLPVQALNEPDFNLINNLLKVRGISIAIILMILDFSEGELKMHINTTGMYVWEIYLHTSCVKKIMRIFVSEQNMYSLVYINFVVAFKIVSIVQNKTRFLG